MSRLFFCSVPKRLLAGLLPAVCAAERGARRTGEGVVGCVGLPVAATIAVAIIVIVAIVPGAERGSSDRARGCDGAADDVAGHDTGCGSPAIPSIAPLARQSGVGVADPFAAIGRVTLRLTDLAPWPSGILRSACSADRSPAIRPGAGTWSGRKG